MGVCCDGRGRAVRMSAAQLVCAPTLAVDRSDPAAHSEPEIGRRHG
jgi:hypothetical protein